MYLEFKPSDNITTGTLNQSLNPFKIYPNPASDIVNISNSQGEYSTISIVLYDNIGRKVKTIKGVNRFSTEGLENGLYQMVIFEGDELLLNQKLLISK